MLEAIEGVLPKERLEWIVIYGDIINPNLSFSNGEVSYPRGSLKVGLQSFNRRVPKEIN
jgi:UDP-GlcNAc3NAcA epimerase